MTTPHRSGIIPLVIIAIAVVSALIGGTAVAVSKPGEPTSAVGAGVSAGIPAAVAAEPAGPAAMTLAFLTAAVPAAIAYWLKSRAHDATKADLLDATQAHNDSLASIVEPIAQALPALLSPSQAVKGSMLTQDQTAALRKRLDDAKAQLAATGSAPVVAIPPPTIPAT